MPRDICANELAKARSAKAREMAAVHDGNVKIRKTAQRCDMAGDAGMIGIVDQGVTMRTFNCPARANWNDAKLMIADNNRHYNRARLHPQGPVARVMAKNEVLER